VPLEFVYDRGSPSDDAELCDGWEAALHPDAEVCPACGNGPLADDERYRSPIICPLGFWGLQKIIERHDPKPDDAGMVAPTTERRYLPVVSRVLFASSDKVPPAERDATVRMLAPSLRALTTAETWDEWRRAVMRYQDLLLVLPHHGISAGMGYLEIGDESQPSEARRLRRDQLRKGVVNPYKVTPGPIVLLLGCRTAQGIEDGYIALARRFQQLPVSIIVGTLAEVLGRHAAPVARELVSQLLNVDDPTLDFGTIMRRVRRRMLADGYLMALSLVALGDAEWRLTPRAQEA
jgi:hypothetical protein